MKINDNIGFMHEDQHGKRKWARASIVEVAPDGILCVNIWEFDGRDVDGDPWYVNISPSSCNALGF